MANQLRGQRNCCRRGCWIPRPVGKMGITKENEKYFNSGMMLIDLVRWRAKSITQKVLDYINQNPEKLRFHDQDALNAILYNDWLHLHPQWNAQSNHCNGNHFSTRTELLEPYAETREDPKLIHFCGHVKPWHENCENPYRGVPEVSRNG